MIGVEEYSNVKEKAAELGCNVPQKIAILPRNFENVKKKQELLHEGTAATVRVLWREKGIVETPIEKEGEIIPFVVEEAFGWIGPLIFLASFFITENPYLIDVALGVISNYLTDFFKGIVGEKRVKLDIVVETKSGSYKRINYKGPPEGLEELPKIIRETHDKQ